MKIHGQGSIIPLENKPKYKCRKWRLYVSTDAGQKTRRFSGTWSEAKAALEAFKDELAATVDESESFAAYAESWLSYRANLGTLAPGTIAQDARNVRALLRSGLSSTALHEITPTQCRDELIWIKTHPVGVDHDLTNTTMNKIYITLAAILAQAVDDGLIAVSPMKHITPPRRDTKEREALEPAQLLQLVHDLESVPLDGRTMAVYFITLLGLRRAEACALSDSDVTESVFVHRAVKERNGKIGATKYPASTRTLPAPPLLLTKVDEWRELRNERGHSDAITLCNNSRGGVLRPQLLQRWWTGDNCHIGMAHKLGYPDITLHQLRHSNLSMVARHMSPYDLQRYAGWSSIEPARVYIHADISNLERAITKIYG